MSLKPNYGDESKKGQIPHSNMRKQMTILKETIQIIGDSFEFQFLDSNASKALIFLISCYRNFEVDEELLENCVIIMNIPEDTLLDTIQDFFYMHKTIIPDTLFEVIAKMSDILNQK